MGRHAEAHGPPGTCCRSASGTASARPQLTALFAIRHREAPDGLRSQIFTTGASVKINGFAAGSALAGPLAAHSLGTGLLAAAFVECFAVLVFLACGIDGCDVQTPFRTPSPARAA
ncbi:hypothetical protein SAMN05216266_109149 [Amycolatopsis marina]|uniref:Uncharacterized protein n=1 Tax=Amycolatopsis marina TaxID=490629 RepID=A0A1I1AGZ3_9PSEU|nr:hypothetical protein SAMN05216266_109149 [Amycolatopsis marina]